MGFLDDKRMINYTLNDLEEDIVIKGEEDVESRVTANVATEVVTRETESGVNRENGVQTERRF